MSAVRNEKRRRCGQLPGYWRHLTGLPVTAIGLFIAIRNWGNPTLVLLGAVIAFVGNVFPFFITD